MPEDLKYADLLQRIRDLGPWHHDIRLKEDLSINNALGDKVPTRAENEGITLIDTRDLYAETLAGVYPDGLAGKRFLDCACNAGIYCFFSREWGADYSFGFDIREHWIKQANFVKEHREVAPCDQIDFEVLDLYDLPGKNFEPFDYTFFKGIFYHLPDPIHGLKIAADLTSDIIVVNTASTYKPENPGGMTPRRRPNSDAIMSGTAELAWFPNGPRAILLILGWLGFREFKLTRFMQKNKHHRFELFAAREEGRLENLKGHKMNFLVRDYE